SAINVPEQRSAMKLDEVQEAAQKQFARQSHRYGQGHILENIDDVRQAANRMQLPIPSRVLDIATGAGHTGLFFASLGHEVTLADLASPMLERAAEAAAARGLKIKTQLHAAEEIPDANETFDLVTCRVAAHHFSAPAKFISDTARVLKSGGWLLLIDGSVQDNESEAESWLHAVEKLRDPSHHRFLSLGSWGKLCEANGLTVVESKLTPFKQPDLDWYFETAATSPENRQKVLEQIENVPASARNLFQLGIESGKIVWWWQRLTLIARKT
ncbi:MAG: class I SAM-dependent methyltransferase, partial [Verrucomicrobiota bacterium]